jgi:DeoR family glycerol-3-phosphate regulon repressor
MDFDLDKIAVKRLAIERSARALALGDAGKFGRRAVARIAPPAAFAALICDRAPVAALRDRLVSAGVEIREP